MKFNKLLNDKRAFTGLEAAIVLTAFVVVAAVFSYVVLGAGFFTSEKSKEVIHTGVEQATSSMEIAGDVIGHGWNYSFVNINKTGLNGTWNVSGAADAENYRSYYAWANSTATQHIENTSVLTIVEFQVELAAGQNPMDMDKVVISYSDDDTYVSKLDRVSDGNASKGNFTVGTTTGKWNYTLMTTEMGSAKMLDPTEKMLVLVGLPYPGVSVYGEFYIDIKPAQGATLTITRTAPGAIQKTMVLR